MPGLLSSDTGIFSTDLEADCQDTPEQCQSIPTILTRVLRQDRHEQHAPVTQPHTILVVEDEASIASFVALYLKNAGYQVKAVGTGSAALNQVAAGMPSMIILDLNLPDMDGIEICRRIRKSSDVPILMLTARDEDVDKIIGLEVGADDYLTKPFNPRELVARVKSVLRRSAPRSAVTSRRSSATVSSSSTPASERSTWATTRSSSRRRSSTSSGSCSTIAVSC